MFTFRCGDRFRRREFPKQDPRLPKKEARHCATRNTDEDCKQSGENRSHKKWLFLLSSIAGFDALFQLVRKSP
jgi:hypothetical protein